MLTRIAATAFLLAALPVTQVLADDMVPWPPRVGSFDAPQNRPVAHPGPMVDVRKLPSGRVFRSLKLHERKAVQRELRRMGYYEGKIDGIWGPGTWYGTWCYAERVGEMEMMETESGSLRLFQHITN